MENLNNRHSNEQKELIDWINSLYGIVWGAYWSHYLTNIAQSKVPISLLLEIQEFKVINGKYDFSCFFSVYCILCLALFSYFFVIWSRSLPDWLSQRNGSEIIWGNRKYLRVGLTTIGMLGFNGFLFGELNKALILGIIATIVWMLMILCSINHYRLQHVNL